MIFDRNWAEYFDWWVTYVIIMAGIAVGAVVYGIIQTFRGK